MSGRIKHRLLLAFTTSNLLAAVACLGYLCAVPTELHILNWQPPPADTAYRQCGTPRALDSALREAGVPFPALFVRIAIFESGWKFTEGIGVYRNPFGMQCSWRVAECVQGRDGSYSVYASRMAAVRDLKAWVDLHPPPPNAEGEAWLRGRGWNPFPGYWEYLSTINP